MVQSPLSAQSAARLIAHRARFPYTRQILPFGRGRVNGRALFRPSGNEVAARSLGLGRFEDEEVNPQRNRTRPQRGNGLTPEEQWKTQVPR